MARLVAARCPPFGCRLRLLCLPSPPKAARHPPPGGPNPASGSSCTTPNTLSVPPVPHRSTPESFSRKPSLPLEKSCFGRDEATGFFPETRRNSVLIPNSVPITVSPKSPAHAKEEVSPPARPSSKTQSHARECH